ncbi:hypothetical protein B0T25DRAFT_528788 [Lasiosphaeria hispida]|uniref:Uncharacterized protein n=1 Tax=Lasiosphaeria hispida TaxID=260671 RepID=A0AAJ0HW18_9PEZI|nr:hypothetical protein B0T25DRAFT_528788 [Lasiosphaeria hispida]
MDDDLFPQTTPPKLTALGSCAHAPNRGVSLFQKHANNRPYFSSGRPPPVGTLLHLPHIAHRDTQGPLNLPLAQCFFRIHTRSPSLEPTVVGPSSSRLGSIAFSAVGRLCPAEWSYWKKVEDGSRAKSRSFRRMIWRPAIVCARPGDGRIHKMFKTDMPVATHSTHASWVSGRSPSPQTSTRRGSLNSGTVGVVGVKDFVDGG